MPRKRAVNGSGMQPRKRDDGRWECRIKIGIDPGTGKAIKKSVYGKTAEECAKKLRAMSAAIDSGTYAEPSKMTIGQWLDTWHAEYLGGVKQSTVIHYGGYIANHLKPYIGAVKLAALQPHMIQTLYNKLLRSAKNPNGLSAKSIKNLHGILHKALKQAVMLGYIHANPSDACVLPRIEKKEVSFLEEGDVQAFLKAVRGHKFENMYTTDLFTGMRQGEILGLTWDCIDFDAGIITVEKQLQREHIKGGEYKLVSNKNDRVRKIMPAPFVLDVLKQQRRTQMEQQLMAGEVWSNPWKLVFTNEVGGHLCATTVYKNFKKIVASIGVPDTRFHDLRHTYAVISLQNGDDIKTVQQNVGHATASFTLDVYGHVSTRMQQDSAKRMQNFIDELQCAK